VNSLKASGLDPSEALDEVVSKGDPFLLQASLPLWSKRRLGERLGPRFADASFELPVGEWSGPVVSSYGEHAVWVHEVIGERLPAIEQIRDKVKAELHRQWEGEEMREAQKRLRIGAQIRVAGREDPPAPLLAMSRHSLLQQRLFQHPFLEQTFDLRIRQTQQRRTDLACVLAE
jgi:hypothetical protein